MLRSIRNGNVIHDAAARPPEPPHHATQAALRNSRRLDIAHTLWMSARGGSVFVDQLSVPNGLLVIVCPFIAVADLTNGEDGPGVELTSFVLGGSLSLGVTEFTRPVMLGRWAPGCTLAWCRATL